MLIEVDASCVGPGHSAGVELFTYGLLRGFGALASHEIRVDILRGTLADWRREVPAEGIRWTESDVPLLLDSRLGQRLRRHLPRQLLASPAARGMVDLIRGRARPARATGADVTLYPWHCVPARSRPSVVVLHDLRQFQPGLGSEGFAKVIRDNVARASAVVVSWPHPFQQALRHFPDFRDKMTMIPLPTLHTRPPDLAPRPEPGLLLYPSSLGRHKNHATLLEAMALLPELTLVCPGPIVEPQAHQVRQRIARPDLAGRVRFPGFVPADQLADLYSRASAVVIPSVWEAASGPMFEAFSWGLPVACSDVEPLRAQAEFARADVRFFDAHDPRSIADTIRELLANRDHHARASVRAGQLLAARTWTDTARDYTAVLEWVGSGRSGPIPVSSFLAPAR